MRLSTDETSATIIRFSGAIRVNFIIRVIDAMPTIIEELKYVAGMVLIVWPFFPFCIFGDIIFAHDQLHAIIIDRSNCAVWDIAVAMKNEAFLELEGVLVDVCYVSQLLVVRRVDMHVGMKIMLIPVWHDRSRFLSEVRPLNREGIPFPVRASMYRVRCCIDVFPLNEANVPVKLV